MITEELAAYSVAERGSRLDPDVLHHAKRTVIDWFAATVPGGVVAPATLLADALADEGSRGGALTYPAGKAMSLRGAALVNATAAHTVEFDDIFRDAVYHPGCITVAASLAASQAHRSSGDEFLRAVIVGVEVSTRIGVVVNPAHYRSWHTTGTVGTFGGAASVGTLLRLDARQMAHALATAATMAAGLRKAFESDAMSKPLHAGHAAEAGALAALGACHGLTGVLDILEGAGGFGAAMSEGCDWSRATGGLGVDDNITRLTIKNHGCCGHTFAAIDGALALRASGGFDASDIESIEIGTYRTALDVAGNPDPRTAFEAKFSIPFVVATALLYGKVRLDAFTDARLADPDVRRLMARTSLTVDGELNAVFPRQRAARVRIRTRSGEVFEHFQETRRGDPDSPLTDAELEDKYRELVSPVVGTAAAEQLLKKLWRMEREDPRAVVLAVPPPP